MEETTSKVEFNYNLQVWLKDGIIQRCGHPYTMRQVRPCCMASLIYGRTLEQALFLLDTPAADGSTMREKVGF